VRNFPNREKFSEKFREQQLAGSTAEISDEKIKASMELSSAPFWKEPIRPKLESI
jgi:hypothetical protein